MAAMYVCSCNVLTDTDVRSVAPAAASVAAVYRCLGCRPQCGGCARTIRRLLDEARAAAGCGCPEICAPDATDCPAIERAVAIVSALDAATAEG